HDRELRLEPGTAGADLDRARRLVDTALGRPNELEVLDGVGDVDVDAGKARLPERAVEHFARGSDERRALEVLLIARLLSDEDSARGGRPFSENGLCRVAPQLASAAALGRAGELEEVGRVRDEGGGPGRRLLGEAAQALQVRVVAAKEQAAVP